VSAAETVSSASNTARVTPATTTTTTDQDQQVTSFL
jgi:hypothetical protein